jgi:hypothetical protein
MTDFETPDLFETTPDFFETPDFVDLMMRR